MIYDLISLSKYYELALGYTPDHLGDILGMRRRKPEQILFSSSFSVPKFAPGYREMRQCAMQKYRFVWCNFVMPVPNYDLTKQPIIFRIGFFDPKNDAIDIDLCPIREVRYSITELEKKNLYFRPKRI